MKKINTNELSEDTGSSPGGKFAWAGKEISEALGRKPLSTDLNERHPFDGPSSDKTYEPVTGWQSGDASHRLERLVFVCELSQSVVVTKDAIQSTLNAQPFKPFSLRLTDGTLVPVPHADFMVVSQGGRTAIISTEGEKFSIVDLGLVTTIELGSAAS